MNKNPNSQVSEIANSSSPLLSEAPNLRNWFSSYTYQSPVLDSDEEFCISPIADEGEYEKNGLYVKDSEDEEVENRVDLNKIRKGQQPVPGAGHMNNGCQSNPSNSTEKARKLGYASNTEIPDHPDSLSLPSEPPHIANWFSSYAYESPELDSADFDDSLKPNYTSNNPEKIDEENDRHYKAFTTNVKGGLLSSRKLISEPSEMNARSTGTKNTKLYSAVQKHTSEENNSPENNLCPKTTSGQTTHESDLGDCSNTCNEPVPCQRTSVKITMPMVQEKLQTREVCTETCENKTQKVSKISDNDSGWILLNHKPREPPLKKSKQDENLYISTENKFISSVVDTGRPTVQNEKSPQKFGPKKYKTDLKITSTSSLKDKRPGEVGREVFKEMTNTQYPYAQETAGKWRCPLKNKPNAGPPLKQLRLEKWVRRVLN